jgi:acyl-CoA thioesterase FadM
MPAPFIYEIRVGWGDCDPAKIAYTANIPRWALQAIDAWWETHLGDGWYQMELDHNVGTPFVSLSMDFRSPITPRHRLMCETFPTRLGEKSVSFRVLGRQDGQLCFEGDFTCVFMVADAFKSQPAPQAFRDIVQPHIRAE